MSPRAACRLEQLGFRDVYDFVHGKSFWLAHGLATDGTASDVGRAGTAADRDVPICQLGATVAVALQRIAEHEGWDQCLVTNDDGVVAGRVRARDAAAAGPSALVDGLMEPGPSTIRPDTDLTEVTRRMTERDVASIVVTDPGGRLIGILRRHRGP